MEEFSDTLGHLESLYYHDIDQIDRGNLKDLLNIMAEVAAEGPSDYERQVNDRLLAIDIELPKYPGGLEGEFYQDIDNLAAAFNNLK